MEQELFEGTDLEETKCSRKFCINQRGMSEKMFMRSDLKRENKESLQSTEGGTERKAWQQKKKLPELSNIISQ